MLKDEAFRLKEGEFYGYYELSKYEYHDIKTLKEIINNLLYDCGGYRTIEEVKKILINEVFKKIKRAEFEKHLKSLRANIHDNRDKKCFEEAFSTFVEEERIFFENLLSNDEKEKRSKILKNNKKNKLFSFFGF